MKKKVLLAAFAVFTVVSIGKAQVYLGPALLYGTNIDEPGLQVSGYVPIPQVKNLLVGGDLSFYFAHNYYYFKESFWEINANAHYLFYDEKGLNAYGIGGLDLTSYHLKAKNLTGNTYATYSDSKVGLNLGVGGSKTMNFGSIFAELKYVFSAYDHLTIGAGVRFPIKTK